MRRAADSQSCSAPAPRMLKTTPATARRCQARRGSRGAAEPVGELVELTDRVAEALAEARVADVGRDSAQAVAGQGNLQRRRELDGDDGAGSAGRAAHHADAV